VAAQQLGQSVLIEIHFHALEYRQAAPPCLMPRGIKSLKRLTL